MFQWKSEPRVSNLALNTYNANPDYQTVKISLDEFDLQQYIWKKKGWELITQFRIGDNATLLCTFKKG
jgi:hypothetical protein